MNALNDSRTSTLLPTARIRETSIEYKKAFSLWLKLHRHVSAYH